MEVLLVFSYFLLCISSALRHSHFTIAYLNFNLVFDHSSNLLPSPGSSFVFTGKPFIVGHFFSCRPMATTTYCLDRLRLPRITLSSLSVIGRLRCSGHVFNMGHVHDVIRCRGSTNRKELICFLYSRPYKKI